MKLIIEDFAKIKSASIKCDGITVIAGENNTGKSTIGKVLFSIFNSTTNLKEKIENQRKRETRENLQLYLRNLLFHNQTNNVTMKKYNQVVNKISSELFSKDNNDELNTIIEDTLNYFKLDTNDYFMDNDMVVNLNNKIVDVLKLPDEIITLEVITRYFKRVFFQQMNNVLNEDSDAMVRLIIKDSDMDLIFKDNKCIKFSSKFEIIYNAFYIDNPFIIDDLGEYFGDNILHEHIIESINTDDDDIMNGIFDTISAKEKLSEIYKILEYIIDGEFVEDSGEYYFNSKKLKKTISVNNLSTGLKSFAVIKMLLEKGALKERDVLILDEPEIHLHPQWQTYYAELIVLLQKYFDLTIIVTTHSPYFLESIEVFSAKHKISDKVNYYLSETDEEYVASVNDVTNNIEAIYKKLADPMQELENLRSKIENDIS